MTILWRKPHVEIAPHLEAIVERALEVAGDAALAYPRPSGDWMDPKPRPKIMAYVRKVAKETSNAHVSLATLDDAQSFALEYAAFLPGWIDGTFGRSPRGHASYLQVTLPRAQLYERAEAMCTWFAELLALVPFSAATLGLALEGHYGQVYPRALEHRALDISHMSCVTYDIGNAVHGIGWLTALGDDVVSRLGGEAKLAQTLGPAGSVTKVTGGLVVALGDQPSRGSTEDELAPYRRLAGFLGDELHVPRSVSYFTCAFADGSARYGGREEAMQEAWHRRFVIEHGELVRIFSP